MPPIPPASVSIVTMGRFAVEVDGEPLQRGAWGSRRARTLVKRLAVARGWPVRRDELTELLWPGDTDRSRVRARLSVQLSTVRRVLRGAVIADRESVRLDLQRCALDLMDLDAARDDHDVLALWQGVFLPDDVDAPWAAATRAEVATRASAAAVRVAAHHLSTDRPDRAAAVARRLLDVDPFALRGHELLVHALLRVDRHDQAASAHAAWVAAGRELGIDVPELLPA